MPAQAEILKKALKLKTAAERGDVHIREFARGKYNEFLIYNNITDAQVQAFEKNEQVIKNAKSVTIQGRTFTSMKEFRDWYDVLGLYEKIKVLAEIGRSSDFKNLK